MNMLKKIWAEFIGTFFIIYIGCASIIINNLNRNSIDQLGIALSFAITIMVMVIIFGKISGAHFNPAVSLSFYIIGKLSLKETIFYILSQCGGGLLAGLVLSILFAKSANLGALSVNTNIIAKFDISPRTFIIITEFISSFILMFAYASTLDRNKKIKNLSFVLIGGVYFFTILLLQQIQGAGLNPIRIIIPALFTLQWKNIVFYLGGVFIGALSGGISYRFIYSK